MAQSHFYGNDYDARYQAKLEQSYYDGYDIQNIGRSSKKKINRFKKHKDDYRTS